MQLVYYSRQNTQKGGIRINDKPTIRIAFKSGFVSFNVKACEMLVLSPGNHVLFGNNTDNPIDWYVCKTQDKNGFKIANIKAYKSMIICSVSITVMLKKAFGIPDGKKSCLFLLSTTPEVTADHELYFIIPKPL